MSSPLRLFSQLFGWTVKRVRSMLHLPHPEQAVGVNGVRSDYIKSGKQPAAKGVDGLYTAVNRLVLCKLKQTIADAGSNLATLVGDLVQIKGPLMGPANMDQAFVGSLLQSMYVLCTPFPDGVISRLFHLQWSLCQSTVVCPSLLLNGVCTYGTGTQSPSVQHALPDRMLIGCYHV